MDALIGTRIVDFIHSATGRNAIICDTDGVIVAAKIRSRVGAVHEGARKMLRENLPQALVTLEEEEASGGAMKAGCNLPIWHSGELIGSIGIGGDPERTEPLARLASGLISKELKEREMLDLLIGHAAQMDTAITEVMATAQGAEASQNQVAARVSAVERLVSASLEDIDKTDQVIDTIQSIAANTQMLGLNASIEAAHAREHGQGFAIVAEAVRKLSVQCGDAAETVKATQSHLHESMNNVAANSKDLMAHTNEQTRSSSAIARMVAELKAVSEALMTMTRS